MRQPKLGGPPHHQGRKLPGKLSFTTPDDSLQDIFTQLTHALSVLNGAADLLLTNKQNGPNTQHLGAWLQPQARKAEDAMHRLRELHSGPSSALTDLSQCLTILVLAADMLCAGQLSELDAHECYALLHRNADRATAGLYDVYSQLGADSASYNNL
jgi:hypothetical protein